MITALLDNPLMAWVLFLGLAAAIYWLGGRLQAKGPEAEGKRLPYACGEDISSGEARLSYERFFRLALMFVVVHIATLLIALLPTGAGTREMATVYLLGIAVCVDILVRGER